MKRKTIGAWIGIKKPDTATPFAQKLPALQDDGNDVDGQKVPASG